MPLISCPGCGHQVADVAPVCPRCGRQHPGRPDLPDQPEAPARHTAKSSSTPTWLIGCTAIGCGGVAVLGVIAAIAIPKFSNVVQQAGQAEAEMLLTQAYQAQVDYHRGAGGYTADLERFELRKGSFFTLSVSQASESELCIEATPVENPSLELAAQSMDESGFLHEGAGCQMQEDLDDPDSAAAEPATPEGAGAKPQKR